MEQDSLKDQDGVESIAKRMLLDAASGVMQIRV